MRASDLTAILRDRYHNAEEKKVALSVHLFGIEFAEALANHRIEDICTAADVPVSYGTEIRKGVRLSAYVEIKKRS